MERNSKWGSEEEKIHVEFLDEYFPRKEDVRTITCPLCGIRTSHYAKRATPKFECTPLNGRKPRFPDSPTGEVASGGWTKDHYCWNCTAFKKREILVRECGHEFIKNLSPKSKKVWGITDY